MDSLKLGVDGQQNIDKASVFTNALDKSMLSSITSI